jgi:hypothetical protein
MRRAWSLSLPMMEMHDAPTVILYGLVHVACLGAIAMGWDSAKWA